jgi:Cd2+/Zn2+-exporting ATPase
MQKYLLENLDCANCAVKIEDAAQKTSGVRYARVDFATSTLYLDANDFSQVVRSIKRIEPDIQIKNKDESETTTHSVNLFRKLIPIIAAGILFLAGLIAYERLNSTSYRVGEYLIFGTAYLISGWKVLLSAVRNIIRGQVFDEHFLMSAATLGAIAIGETPEAVGVMLFYLVGEFVQDISVNRSRRSIQALLEVRPDRARVWREDGYVELHPETVLVGERLLIKPGERVPLDGEVLIGKSHVDTSALTGEPVPVRVGPEDSILAGSINIEGVITVEVKRPFQESSISRILDLVEQANSRKAATEKFITKFARIYSPIIFFSAVGVALIPPIFFNGEFSHWLYRALVVLVISCPCALVISIPLGYFGGVGGASRNGILIKGSNFLDILASVKTVVFDKTGTLTRGVFKVTGVIPRNGFSKDEILRYAALAEAGSNHPIAKSLRDALGLREEAQFEDYQEIAGHGVQTKVDGLVVLAGNDSLLHKEKVHHDLKLCDIPGTVVHVAVDGAYAGYVVIADELKNDSREAVRSLRSLGVDQIFMLSGDNLESSRDIALKLGLDDYRAELLPEEKVEILEDIIEQPKRGKTAFIGDGINDAPALARADVGIAMGALGSEATIETADVVIMTDSPARIADAIRIGRKTHTIVWQNIILALAVKSLFIALGISGEATMWQAVFGDMGVALLAVFNATRAFSQNNSTSI